MPNNNTIAEAISSALYRVDFEHLGDSDGGRTDWFTRGRAPKIMRVGVERATLYPMVFLTLEWPVVSRGRVQVGTQQLQVDTTGTDEQVFASITAAVERCLLVFRDVLEGKGVAAPRP